MKTGGVPSFIWMNSHEGDILLVTTLQVNNYVQGPCNCLCCPHHHHPTGSMQMSVLPSTINNTRVHANGCAALHMSTPFTTHQSPAWSKHQPTQCAQVAHCVWPHLSPRYPDLHRLLPHQGLKPPATNL